MTAESSAEQGAIVGDCRDGSVGKEGGGLCDVAKSMEAGTADAFL